MKQFSFSKAADVDSAVNNVSGTSTAQQGASKRFIAGGTTLLDLMKLNVEAPESIIDINRLPLDKIEVTGSGIKVGALVKNADLANHPYVKNNFPVLSQALLSGATAQLRNMATTGGNLLQRTRCMYFRDTAFACNKREPGSGCAAIDGEHRTLAILGTSEHCVATNPSDMNVALMALEAVIHIQSVGGSKKEVPIAEFYLLPGSTPHIENVLKPGDLITHVSIKSIPAGCNSVYLKLRDRASYEFALASAAIVVNVENGKFSHARMALGGVGTRPWRVGDAEKVLIGATPDAETFRQAAEIALRDAKPLPGNKFKVELSRRCIIHSLKLATGLA